MRTVPPVPASRVVSGTVSRSGSTRQVALVATSGRGVDGVLRFYRVHLGRAGFDQVELPAAPGSTAAGFARTRDSVSVTASREGGRTTYSLVATLRTAGR